MNNFQEGFTFIWKIENYSMMPHQKGERLESPSFVVECLDKTKWHLWLYPRSDGRDGKENHISLFLCRSDWTTNRATSKLSVTCALKSLNSEFKKSLFDIEVSFVDKGKGFPKFQEFKDVYNNTPQDILTIVCHVWPPRENSNAPAITSESITLYNYFKSRCSARTTIDVRRRVLTWPITKPNELCKSPHKTDINLENSLEGSPALKLSFFIDKTMNDEYARIEILQIRSSSKKPLFVKCKITVTSADKKEHTSSQDSHLFSANMDEIWCFPDFILIENMDKYAYVDDTMFLQCEFSFSRKGKEHHLEIPVYMPAAFAEKKRTESTELSRQIRRLLVREEFCDVEVRAGEQTFPCHKLVLCAQSPVFRAMFKNNMKEKETGVVEISDVDPLTLEKMLDFLYLEVIEEGLSVDEICELYSAADKYEVLLLQRRCSLLLLSKLSVESVCRALTTADSRNDHFLGSHIYNILSINAREVFHSPQWKKFMIDNPTLSNQTMIKIYMEEPYV